MAVPEIIKLETTSGYGEQLKLGAVRGQEGPSVEAQPQLQQGHQDVGGDLQGQQQEGHRALV